MTASSRPPQRSRKLIVIVVAAAAALITALAIGIPLLSQASERASKLDAYNADVERVDAAVESAEDARQSFVEQYIEPVLGSDPNAIPEESVLGEFEPYCEALRQAPDGLFKVDNIAVDECNGGWTEANRKATINAFSGEAVEGEAYYPDERVYIEGTPSEVAAEREKVEAGISRLADFVNQSESDSPLGVTDTGERTLSLDPEIIQADTLIYLAELFTLAFENPTGGPWEATLVTIETGEPRTNEDGQYVLDTASFADLREKINEVFISERDLSIEGYNVAGGEDAEVILPDARLIQEYIDQAKLLVEEAEAFQR